MPRHARPLPLRLADQEKFHEYRDLLFELLESDTWLSHYVTTLLRIGEKEGFTKLAAEPEKILTTLEGDIEQFGIDLEYAIKLHRLYPQLFPDPPSKAPAVITTSAAA